MALVVVERTFEKPITFEEFNGIREKGSWCFDAYRIEFLRSYLSKDGVRMICFYEAPDAESVRSVSRRLGVKFDRVWSADVYEPEH